MKNFFTPKVKEAVIKRINDLTPESKREWGVMSVTQMFCHLSDQIKLALGIRQSPLEGPAIFKTQLGIFLALYVVPWKKGESSPTVMDKDKKGTPSKGFDVDKAELINLLNQLFHSKEGSLHSHPFFGRFTKKQWGRMIAKHTNHHLRQFGV
ncbi:MAG: DUF1569 domain-containing protein [Solirubrobacteraceae bacterium]